MKRILSFILALTMCISMAAAVFAADINFTDVSTSDWFYNDVKTAVEAGLVNGKSATAFAPNDNLTYAESIKLAACMNQVYMKGEVTLANGEPWYKPYVDYCMENGIIDKEYNYSENVTRADYMGIFAKALTDDGLKAINNVPDNSIPDVPSSRAYAAGVYKLYRAGILRGVDDAHNCNPSANITRAEVAAILTRMMNKDKRVEFEMPEFKGTLSNEGTIDDDITNMNPATEFKNEPADEPNDEPKGDPIIEDVEIKTEYESVVVKPDASEEYEFESDNNNYILSVLTIHKQPVGKEYEEYGAKHELEVQVYGGKPPYKYEWQYNGFRNQKTVIENGDYAIGAADRILTLSVEKENTLLGVAISCKITDSEGTELVSDSVKVYGPFSMPVDSYTINKVGQEYELAGKIADGIIRKGDKVSVERDGKIIATGTAIDLKMFDKSLEEGVKNDNVGIVFELSEGVSPKTGDTVIKYKDTHVVDTSDVVN